MAGHPARNLSVRCAVNQSGRVICENSQRGSPTAMTTATRVTAMLPPQCSKSMRGRHDNHPDTRSLPGMLRQKWSRGQVEARLANVPPCLIGMEACVGAHHLSRKLQMLGHDARLMPAKYVRPYSKGQKNDFRDAEAITEAVQRPTMKFVATKTAEQLDLRSARTRRATKLPPRRRAA